MNTTIEPDGTIVTRSKIEPRPGWPCPACGGSGRMNDGHLSYSMQDGEAVTKYRPQSNCGVCNGVGRVEVRAIQPTAKAGEEW